jgi:glutamate-5-semialdehyde dehydrogenase
VLAANADDRAAARDLPNLEPARLARLALDAGKLDGVCHGLDQLAAAPELLGRPTVRRELDDGLVLEQVPAPLGVLAVVFEARPDAVPQICGLALKSGNAVMLKGGREALQTNRALVAAIHRVLVAHALDPACVALLEQREDLEDLLAHHDLIDLVIARGGKAFVHHVQTHTKIPVMGHAEGLCHLYLHRSADPTKAAAIAVDAKCGYPAACNAIETLLWDAPRPPRSMHASPPCRPAASSCAPARTRARHPSLLPATDADWDTEYGALVLAVRQVDDESAALAHIAAHGSRHTEAIVAEDDAPPPNASSPPSTPPTCSGTPAPGSPTATASASAPRSASRPASSTPAAPSAPAACSPTAGCSAATATSPTTTAPASARSPTAICSSPVSPVSCGR